MLRILIVCTGNTCRSPMAEALLNAKIRQNHREDDIRILSAGLATGVAFPASQGAIQAMNKRGLDLSSHSSRQIRPEHLKAADLILTMTFSHKRSLLSRFGEAADKTFTLAEYADMPGEIADPFGGDAATYEQCAQQIEQMIAVIWDKIVNLAGKKA